MAIGDLVRTGVADCGTCLRFFSRLPLPPPGPTERPFGAAIALLPLAGLIVGACGALPLALGDVLGLPHVMAATLATAGGVLATGGLHEDGLADAADGLGGHSRHRRLEIMRDSRIGTYGVLALILALGWRVLALGALLDAGPRWGAAAGLLAAATVSRALCLLPLALLPPARADGLGHGVGALDRGALTACLGLAAILGTALPLLAGFSPIRVALAGLLAVSAAYGVTALARRRLGGHTGDVAGAAQMLGEAAFYLGLLTAPSVL